MSRLKKLRFTKKRLGLLISISIIIIGLIPHLILISISGSNYSYTVDPISLESEDGTYISAFKYSPKGEKRNCGIVVSHYFTGNKFFMHPLSMELAKRGFTVINIDFRGHGASGGYYLDSEYYNDMKAAVEYIEYALPYITKVGLVGHSLGAIVALSLAKTYPNRINATVTIGYIPSNMINISNLLIAIGLLEQSYTEEDILESLMTYTGLPNVEIGELYGDFNSGDAIKGVVSPFSGHLFEVIDPVIIHQTVQWFEQAFNGELASDIFIIVPFFQIFSYISQFGVIALTFVLIAYLSNYIFKRKIVYPEKKILKNGGNISIYTLIKYYSIYITFIGFSIFLIQLDIFTDIITLSTANLILLLSIGIAFGIIIVYYFLRLHEEKKFFIKTIFLKIKEMCSTNSGYSILYGIIAALLLTSSLAVAWHWNLQNILPTPSQIEIMIGITLIIFPFFLIKEFYFRIIQGGLKNSNRLKEYFTMVGIGIFMDNLLIGLIKLFSIINIVYVPETYIYLLGLIIFSIIQQFTTTWVYMWSGRNILGSTIFLSLFYAWMSVIFLPSYGFL